MKLFCKKEVQGAISLFLVAIMLPMMVISALMVDTARYQLAKSMVASAGDLAMNAALADYDAILKDVYGLFAMSQVDDVEKNVRNYFEETVVSYGVVGKEDAGDYVQELLGQVYEYLLVEDKETADFLAMTIDDSAIKVNKVESSSLANASILEKQIVEYMKYRAPIGFGMSFLDSLSAFTKVDKQTDVVQAQVNAQYSLGDASSANDVLYKAIREYDTTYEKLEPTPLTDARWHLKNYGNILMGYVPEYEKLHRLASAFCVEAYLGKWELPDSNRSDSGFVILNPSGSYIIQGESLSVSGHMADSNILFGESYIDPLDRYITPFLNNKTSVINTLSAYGSTARIQITLAELDDETKWNTAIDQFRQVDDFYKNSFGSYISALKQLDEYTIAMKAYDEKMTAKIGELEENRKAAEKTAKEATDKRVELLEKYGEAGERLNQRTAEEIQDGNAYLANEKKLKELQGLTGTDAVAAEAEIAKLEQENQDISERLGEAFPQITEDIKFQDSYSASDNELVLKSAEAQAEQENYQEEKEEKEKQLSEKRSQYQEVLASCKDAVNCFNQDAVNYKSIKAAIKTKITNKAVEISNEFKLIEADVRSLDTLLTDAENKYSEAEKAIEKYTKDVETWSKSNTSYKSGGEDNFSDVQSADIKAAENVFSEEEVKELLTKIQLEHEKVSKILEEVKANFTYMGGSKIEDITNADQIAELIKARADRSFDLTHDIDAHRLDTLQELIVPVPCCSFLNYLHQTYKDSSEKTDEQTEDESTYETIKSSNNITKAIEDDKIEEESGENKYGYTYGKDTGFSSSQQSDEDGEKTDEEKTKSSKKADKDGLDANKSEAGNWLKGLSGAMETGRDKLYVMEYLFEYFSYNTIVQDLAREGGAKPDWFNSKKAVYEKYLDAPQTGSHIKINGLNNKNYGAEIEYVLYGNKKNASANVTAAYASIFAVRLLFNSVYAFTSSDIRSQTRAVALGVQAASGGWIPYQLVQVVLQLALAMGESAIDLKNLEAGAKVVIVKTKDTWTLSMEGVKNLAKGAIESVAGEVVDKAAKAVQNKIKEIVDAGAEELSDVVSDVEKDLEQMAKGAAENLLDSIFSQINAVVDEKMNQTVNAIFYPPGGSPLVNGEDIKAEAEVRFKETIDALKGEINTLMNDLAAKNSDNALLSAACEAGGKLAEQALDEAYTELTKSLLEVPIDTASVSELVYKQIYSVKNKIAAKVEETMEGMISKVSGTIQTEINKVAGEVKNAAEEATDKAKEKMTKSINDFVDNKLSFGATKMDTGSGTSLTQASGNGAKSSSMASAITFGYSDYLRLFVFVGLCASDKSGSMINRIGDLIETNISSAGEGSDLYHRKGSGFKIANAKTYVSISADVELEMMFLRLGIFQKQVDSFNEEYEEEQKINLGDTMKVHYLGISGY